MFVSYKFFIVNVILQTLMLFMAVRSGDFDVLGCQFHKWQQYIQELFHFKKRHRIQYRFPLVFTVTNDLWDQMHFAGAFPCLLSSIILRHVVLQRSKFAAIFKRCVCKI